MSSAKPSGLSKTDTRPDLAKVEPVRQRLIEVRHDIESFVFERNKHIKMAILTILAEEHAILVGPPGVAKSMIINQLTQRITGAKLFETLMHPQITPDDLFVSHTSLDVTDDGKGKQSMSTVYHTDGGVTLASAEIFFGDEVYKCHPKTLNSLLTLMNERKFDLNRKRYDAPLISGFFASNELPEIDGSDGLAAFHDRILTRLPTDPLKSMDSRIKVLKTQLAHRRNLAAGRAIAVKTISLKELKQLQGVVPQIYVPEDVMVRLLELADMVEKQMDTCISTRRVEKSVKLLQAGALLAGRNEVAKDDLTILRYVFWEDPDKFEDTATLIRDNVLDPTERKLEVIKLSAYEMLSFAQKKVDDGDIWGETTDEEMQGINGCARQLDDLARNEPNMALRKKVEEVRRQIMADKNAFLASIGNGS